MEYKNLINNSLKNINTNIYTQLGFCDENGITDKFIKLYTNYRILLDKYLMNKLSLKKYDDEMSDSELIFIPMDKEFQNSEQLLSTMGLKYIYLVNVLHLEKLSPDYINFFLNLTDDDLRNPSSEIFDAVEKTFKTVIDSSYDDITLTSYENYNYIFSTKDLVIGVTFDEDADIGLGEDEEWFENFMQKNEYLYDLLPTISKNASEILGVETHFIRLDGNIIKKIDKIL